jgi:hypothetical protein
VVWGYSNSGTALRAVPGSLYPDRPTLAASAAAKVGHPTFLFVQPQELRGCHRGYIRSELHVRWCILCAVDSPCNTDSAYVGVLHSRPQQMGFCLLTLPLDARYSGYNLRGGPPRRKTREGSDLRVTSHHSRSARNGVQRAAPSRGTYFNYADRRCSGSPYWRPGGEREHDTRNI